MIIKLKPEIYIKIIFKAYKEEGFKYRRTQLMYILYLTVEIYFDIIRSFFYILLTVHLSISSDNDPTWCTLALFFNMSTTILYMFRELHAHHQDVELYWYSIWYRPLIQWPSGAQVERIGVLSQPVYRTATEREDDNKCCINTIQPPDDEHVMLETCRGL